MVCGLGGALVLPVLSRARLWSPLCCSWPPEPGLSLSVFPSLTPSWEGVPLSKEGFWGCQNPGLVPGGVAECADPCSLSPWRASCPGVVEVALEDSGLCADVLGSLRPRTSTWQWLRIGAWPAAAPAGEKEGGDPLGQQVPPAAPASWEAATSERRARGGGVLLGAGRGWVGVKWAVPGTAFELQSRCSWPHG